MFCCSYRFFRITNSSVLVSGSSDQVFRSICLMINIKIKTVNSHEGILVLIVKEFSSK